MKKAVSLALAASMLASISTGCSFGGDNDFKLDTKQPVVLTIVGNLDNFEGLETVIADFEEEYPNCTVDYQKMDDYAKTLPQRLANESSSTNMFLSSRGDFINEADCLDYALDMAATESGIDLSATNPSMTNSQLVDGKLYTIPLAANPRGMIVNTTLLEENGVKDPENWEEFLAACETLRQKGYVPIQAQNSYIGLGIAYSYLANSIVHDENYESVFEELNSLTPGSGRHLEDAFTRVNTLVEKEYIVYSEADGWENNYDDAIMNFFEGDVAFFPGTAEAVSGMKKREERSESFTAKPFEYEFTCVPIGDDGKYCYWQTWSGISINKLADNENWSCAFIDFLFREENISQLASTKGMPSNTKKATDDARFASLYEIDEAHMADPLKFQISYYSQLNKTFQQIVLPLDDPQRVNAQGATELFEELIAQKRNEE